MLPHTTHSSERVVHTRIPEYLKRVFCVHLMDFDFALSQMVQLCVAPKGVFKASKHRKLTKNHWSRDDPAFVVLQVVFLAFATLSFGVGFQVPLTSLLRLVGWEIGVHFLLLGVVLSSLMWYLANRFLLIRVGGLSHSTQQEVEWLHAFDIHCNAFFPLFLLLYVLQYVLLPLLLRPSFIPQFLANFLWCVAGSYYFYITFIGYLELPILQNQEYFLYPIAGWAITFVLSLFLPVNFTQMVLTAYFGKYHM